MRVLRVTRCGCWPLGRCGIIDDGGNGEGVILEMVTGVVGAAMFAGRGIPISCFWGLVGVVSAGRALCR